MLSSRVEFKRSWENENTLFIIILLENKQVLLDFSASLPENLRQLNSSKSRLQITHVFLAIKVKGFCYIQYLIRLSFRNDIIVLASEFRFECVSELFCCSLFLSLRSKLFSALSLKQFRCLASDLYLLLDSEY